MHESTEPIGKDEYLTPKDLVARYKNVVTLRTLANWRSTGDGPQFTKIGGRVLYALSAVTAWEQRRRIGRVAMGFFSALFCFEIHGS